MTDKLIMINLQLLPETLKTEVLDFILFLQTRSTPVREVPHRKRKAGSSPGKYILSPDFDEPLEDFKDYM